MRAMVYMLRIILLFVLVDFALSAIFNGTYNPLNQVNGTDKIKPVKTRRGAKIRSTSSSSDEKKDESTSGHSLELSLSSSSSGDGVRKKKKKYKPKSSLERVGWKKWHRKCQQCPEDMRIKWRDPDIKWICAGYQRARRSFKSLCMMHYRNCQDGTMFTKIADQRCPNASDIFKHGDHFFYDYSVDLSIDSSKTSDTSSSSSSDSSSDESLSWGTSKLESYERKYVNDLALRNGKKQ